MPQHSFRTKAADGSGEGLDLEITESVIMAHAEEYLQKLHDLKQMGRTFAIGDFGTGYSSLRYIAKLPIDTLKIDRSFIVGMTESPDDLAIVTMIISLGHDLNLTVVAEGVESEAQAKLLRLLKCDEMQGFLFWEPMPASEMEAVLSRRVAH
ncbi:MAG TPA: EAL domain-containing protein [Burkholderiales bacterium]|nr:EAL domain-containing protein [Burkholderiales bacterium]